MIAGPRGVSVWAHSAFFNLDDKMLELVRDGLRGIEAYHRRRDPTVSERYEEFAQDHGLTVVAGSDSKGHENPIGSVRVSYEVVQRLEEERRLLLSGGM